MLASRKAMPQTFVRTVNQRALRSTYTPNLLESAPATGSSQRCQQQRHCRQTATASDVASRVPPSVDNLLPPA